MDSKTKNKLERVIDVLEAGENARRMGDKQKSKARGLYTEAQRWLADESVQGIATGIREAKGKDTGKPCITVYVDKKKPVSEVKNPAPRQVDFDGPVDVDVVEIGELKLQNFTSFQRPLHPSLHIANINRRGGTLGAFVRHRDLPGRLFLISNHHVLAPFRSSDRRIIQPSGEYGGSGGDVIARYIRSFPMSSSQSSFPNLADASLAEVRRGVEIHRRYPKVGTIRGVESRIAKGQKVLLVGSISGVTSGRVKKTNFRMAHHYETPSGKRRVGFRQQILCTHYSQPGDSGALVLNSKGFAIGMHVAGSDTVSVFCRLSPVLEEFECDLVAGGDDNLALENNQVEDADTPLFYPEIPQTIYRQHRYNGSVSWTLTANGIQVDGIVEGTAGEPLTVARIWRDYGSAILASATEYRVPCELIIATICTESGGQQHSIREEPGYLSDKVTPHKVSVGLMQTLISTAQEALSSLEIDRAWLMLPENSIRAGTAYIRQQFSKTKFDPPKVACAYNAGGVYDNNSHNNRWKMRQYPLGTGKHADRFVLWLNDCFRLFAQWPEDEIPELSYYALLNAD